MKTKEYIAYSLIGLMKTKDFETITIKEITENAHVNRSTYYRNFKSKEDILKFQLRKITEEYINKFESVEEKTEKNNDYIVEMIINFINEKKFQNIIPNLQEMNTETKIKALKNIKLNSKGYHIK